MKLYHIKMMLKRNKLVKGIYDKLIGNKKSETEEMGKREALKTTGMEALQQVEKALSNTNAKFFLNFGSLLGMIRDGKFMGHDNDIDFGVIIDENFGWDDLEAALGAYGMKKIKQFTFCGEFTEQTYAYKDLTMDFFKHGEDEANSISHTCYRREGFIYNSAKEYHVKRFRFYKFKGITTMTVDGVEFHIPNEAETYMASVYGEGWRVPDPNWDPAGHPGLELLESPLAEVEYLS